MSLNVFDLASCASKFAGIDYVLDSRVSLLLELILVTCFLRMIDVGRVDSVLLSS